MDALKNHRKMLTSKQKGGLFLGFIVNMYTTNYGSDLIKFLETSVFDRSCLAAIPNFSTVRKTFVKDEIMVQKYKNHYFCEEIRALADTLTGEKTSSPADRARRRRIKDTLIPMTAGIMALYASAGSYFFLQNKVWQNSIILIASILPLMILAVWLYIRKD